MIGFFKVLNNENEVVAQYKYAAVTDRQKQVIKKTGAKIICCCNKKEVLEMKVASDGRIYPAKKGMGEKHDKRCPHYINPKKEQLWSIKHTDSGLYYHVAASFATAEDYMKELNKVTYDRLIYPEVRLPDNWLDFNKKLQISAKYFLTAGGENLFSILTTNNRKIEELDKNKAYFIYGKVESVKRTSFNPQILYIDISDCFGYKQRFYLEREIYEEAAKRIYHKDNPIMAGGFVYKKSDKSRMLTFSDYHMSEVTDIGVLQ